MAAATLILKLKENQKLEVAARKLQSNGALHM